MFVSLNSKIQVLYSDDTCFSVASISEHKKASFCLSAEEELLGVIVGMAFLPDPVFIAGTVPEEM